MIEKTMAYPHNGVLYYIAVKNKWVWLLWANLGCFPGYIVKWKKQSSKEHTHMHTELPFVQ